MGAIEEVMQLEEQLRQAELGPDPKFFEEYLDDEALLDGQKVKAMVVEHHRPGKDQKFSKVEMSDYKAIEHGPAVVVTCTGSYTGSKGAFTMKFMRVWLKKGPQWKIIAASTLP